MSTINASVDPLYVVDGIVVSNAAIPNGQNAVSCAQCGGNPRNQDNPVNRIADLNPGDIERIEVLKGGSAAAIYGSKATNGVVIITTKRGQFGKPQFSLSQRFGFSSRANELGSRIFADTTEAFSVFSDSAGVRAAFPLIKNEELILLRAEANIGLDNLAAAVPDIDLVRTTSGGLPAYAGQSTSRRCWPNCFTTSVTR